MTLTAVFQHNTSTKSRVEMSATAIAFSVEDRGLGYTVTWQDENRTHHQFSSDHMVGVEISGTAVRDSHPIPTEAR